MMMYKNIVNQVKYIHNNNHKLKKITFLKNRLKKHEKYIKLGL